MLTALVSDGLPRFERRFKELLNENAIREIANFSSQLRVEAGQIEERIDNNQRFRCRRSTIIRVATLH